LNIVKTHFLIVFFFGSLLISAIVSAESLVIDGDRQFDFGRELMDDGKYELAVKEFERFMHFFPDDPRVASVRYLTGVCYLRERRYENARKVFTEIFSSDRDGEFAGKSIFMMGETYYEEGFPEKAEYFFSEAAKNYPSFDLKNASFYRLGWARMREHRWKEASEEFGRVQKGSSLYDNAQVLVTQSLKGDLLPSKDPVTAGVMAVVPGLGHVYLSRYKDAAVAFLLNGLFIWATVESFSQDHNVLGGILAFFELGWYAGNIYSAVNGAHKYNRNVRNDFSNSFRDKLDLKVLTSRKGPEGVLLTFQF
jgi:tetratricopeptide (TPR) repeat protein